MAKFEVRVLFGGACFEDLGEDGVGVHGVLAT